MRMTYDVLGAEATTGYFPRVDTAHSGLDRHLTHIEKAAAELDIPVIASLNGSSPGGWTGYASMIADTGVDALELNVYLVAADVENAGAEALSAARASTLSDSESLSSIRKIIAPGLAMSLSSRRTLGTSAPDALR